MISIFSRILSGTIRMFGLKLSVTFSVMIGMLLVFLLWLICIGGIICETFEDLVLECDISTKDRRKYNSLMNGILIDWFYNPPQVQGTIFDRIVESLFESVKITKSSYIIFRSQENPVNAENFWIEALDINVDDIDWAFVHDNNFSSTIETQIRAFYFKIFHRTICTNQFFMNLVELIPVCVISVKIQLNLTFVCFVSATKSVPYGVI